MKTAIQELLEYIEKYGSVVPLEQDRIYIKAEELLAKEKEQITESYYQGNLSGEKFMWRIVRAPHDVAPFYNYRIHPEEYYDKNYNNESNT